MQFPNAISALYYEQNITIKSMFVTEFGEEMCWWQLLDVGDRFGHFDQEHPLFFYISVGHQDQESVANIWKLLQNFYSLASLSLNITFQYLILNDKVCSFRDFDGNFVMLATFLILSPTSFCHQQNSSLFTTLLLLYKHRLSYWK